MAIQKDVTFAEYMWIDGTKPTQQIRSKTRIVQVDESQKVKPEDFPDWGFDGSSTNQAEGNDSDCELKPVYVIGDPIRGTGNFLVLCEVLNADGTIHESNSRAKLRAVLDAGGGQLEAVVGFEQEYTLFKDGRPLGFPECGEAVPQGSYYCGVGDKNIYGRDIIEEHARACAEVGINIYGINAEVMPGQWEYQVGYRGFEGDENGILENCDQRWIANWLLHRIAEEYGVDVNFENKPVQGDWNGAGCHTNFSTKNMRDPNKGHATIAQSIQRLRQKHMDHVALYGAGLQSRLTGLHETCAMNEFSSGISDRGASIRIPMGVARKGYGYIEDRRPGANSDPYIVAARLIMTIADLPEETANFSYFTQLKKEVVGA